MTGYARRSPMAFKFAKGWHEQANIAWSDLDEAARKMKKWVDKKWWHIEYRIRDMMLVKLLPQQFKSLRLVYKGLVRRYKGPFPIMRRIGKVSYKVELPSRLKIHPVFYVNYYKDDPSRGLSKKAFTVVVTSYDKKVEHIIPDQVIRRWGVPLATEFLVKWKGLLESMARRELADTLW